MKVRFYSLIFCLITGHIAFCQTKPDTSYVEMYNHKMTIKTYLSTNSIDIKIKNNFYKPNNPLNAGVGFSLKNTVVDFEYDVGLIQLGGSKRGKTKSIDFQVHRYGRSFLLDLFYQKYKGFYQGDKKIQLYPELSIRQIGAEGSYLYNGSKFSARAAFEQSEKQLQSAGSVVLGGGIYLYKIKSGNLFLSGNNTDNLQLGVNAGYAYSWVLNKHWLLSGMATIGSNFGNGPERIKDRKIELYPTAFARGSAGYHKLDWAVYFSFLIHNKSVYFSQDDRINITPISFQLTYVKHFDRFFKKKK